jgi:hypothetical protein
MFTRATITAVAIALAATNVASAQSFNTPSQNAIDFQMNGEVSRPAAALPTNTRVSKAVLQHDSLSQQAIDFQVNGEVSRPGVTSLAGAYGSAVAPKRIHRQRVVVPQTRDFQDEPGR